MLHEEIDRGYRIRLERDGTPLTFAEWLDALESEDAFASWYSDELSSCRFGACFWEHPPLTAADMDTDAEFVLLDAPALAGVQANYRPFSNHFPSRLSGDPVCFPSLGHDALLITPGPAVGEQAGAHLLAFLRQAPRQSVLTLWKLVAKTVSQRLSGTPLWLSTSGLGVYWLHVRIDSIPKYYQHGPYRSANYLREC